MISCYDERERQFTSGVKTQTRRFSDEAGATRDTGAQELLCLAHRPVRGRYGWPPATSRRGGLAGRGQRNPWSDGQVTVKCDMPAGSTGATHFVLDVFGYFQ